MKKLIHKSESRGHANHGWLDSYHTFSFANYYDESRINFGLLRVLNDDKVAPARGFGAHPHDNMEIISIPLKGALEHKDSMSNSGVIMANDIQIMSAGTGITHAEYNHSASEEVNFLQIWVFPKERNIKPRYDQKTFNPEQRLNQILNVISPDKNNSNTLWINQDAWFSLSNPEEGKELEYKFNSKQSGLYLFVIEGKVEIDGEVLNRRDGIGITETQSLNIKALEKSEILLMEVPVVF